MTAYLVAGLGFGDEGKGSVVDCLVRRTGARLVVKASGGAQCGHNVVTPDGRHHCFAQFGAGTFAGARTYLGPDFKFDPLAFAAEARALGPTLGDALPSVAVDERAPVLTPWHVGLNRLRERARGADRHGSCGMGIGELGADLAAGVVVIRAADLRGVGGVLQSKAEAVRADCLERALKLGSGIAAGSGNDIEILTTSAPRWVQRVRNEACPLFLVTTRGEAMAMADGGPVVFEGSQGVLLDEVHGFAPHTTWSDCTFAPAERLLASVLWDAPVVKVGVLRTYATRHGAGPLPTEDHRLAYLLRGGEHNVEQPWQGAFRVGHFDAVLARYALRVLGGVHALALTHLDKFPVGGWGRYRVATGYDSGAGPCRDVSGTPTSEQLRLCAPVYSSDYEHNECVRAAREELETPVGILSAGPTAEDKRVMEEHVPLCHLARRGPR